MSERHLYIPSILHMGDCAICGNIADHPNHIRPEDGAPMTQSGTPLFMHERLRKSKEENQSD